MDKRYSKPNSVYDKSGKRIPGSTFRYVSNGYKEKNPAEEDTKNRKKVIDEIEMLVKSGIELNEACNTLAEAHKDNFKYLPKDNLATIFAGWYNGKVKAKNRVAEGRTW